MPHSRPESAAVSAVRAATHADGLKSDGGSFQSPAFRPLVSGWGLRRWTWLAVAALGLFAGVFSLPAATYGQQVVAAVLLAEARGEGREGMVAVAEVMRRRADAQGTTMLGVARPGTFSSLNGKTHEQLLREFRHHPLFPAALEISRTAYNQPHRLRNTTQGATHFTHKAERPYWALGHAPVAVIGNHAFYRLAR